MATKNNIRSIRFSDELAELIDRQIGDTFTQKFENLVTKCVWELPNREKQLKDIEEQIKKERERLYRLERATEQLRQLENDHLEYVIESLRRSTTQVFNVRTYLLTILYNAPVTISHFYQAEVQHDMDTG